MKLEMETKEPSQWKRNFTSLCKSRGKCCKIVNDSGSENNIVSTKMLK